MLEIKNGKGCIMYIQDLKRKKIASIFAVYDCLPAGLCLDGVVVKTKEDNGQSITEITYKSITFRRAVKNNVKYTACTLSNDKALNCAENWFAVADALLAFLPRLGMNQIIQQQKVVSNNNAQDTLDVLTG